MTLPLLLIGLVAGLPLVLCAQTRAAQSGTSTTSTNNVPRMNTPSGMSRVEISITSAHLCPLPIQALVEIGGIGGGTLQQTYSDPEGRVSVPSGKLYQLKVSGPGIEATVLQFEVNIGETFHHESVPVKVHSDAKNAAPGGTVSAAMLNVPEKARVEFEKEIKDLNAKKLEDAKKHFIKATEQYPKYHWAFNNIGVVDMQLNDEKGARGAFAHAIEINDKNPDATKNLARLKIQDSDYAAAKELLVKSNTVDPGIPTRCSPCLFATQNQPTRRSTRQRREVSQG